MKIRTRVLAGVASLALVGGMAAMVSPAGAAAAPPPIDVTNSAATCNTITGALAFSTPLTLTGPTTGNETVTIKAKLLGCTSPDVDSAVSAWNTAHSTSFSSVFSAATTGTLVSSGGSGCLSLSGMGTSAGVLTNKWAAPKGFKFIPLETVAGKSGNYSQSTINGDDGEQFAVDASQAPYAGSYGQFRIGSAYGTTAISDTITGDSFRGSGGHNGHNSWVNVIGNLDVVNELQLCTGAGIKKLTVGIGGAEIG